MTKTKKTLALITTLYETLLFEKVQQLAGQFEVFSIFAIPWRLIAQAARQIIIPQVVGQFQNTQGKYFFVGVII